LQLRLCSRWDNRSRTLDLKTLTAEYRPSVGGLERQNRFDTALRAGSASFRATETWNQRATGLNILAQAFDPARFAMFRIVAKLFVEEEKLLASAEDEFVETICAR